MVLTKTSHIVKGIVGVPALVGVKVPFGSGPQMACYVLDREASHLDGELVTWLATQVKATTTVASLVSRYRTPYFLQSLQRERSYHQELTFGLPTLCDREKARSGFTILVSMGSSLKMGPIL